MSKSKLSKLLSSKKFPKLEDGPQQEQRLKDLQLKMLRIQQGIWHQKSRAIVVFEGFDAAGKGGAIRRLVEKLDPRGVRVVPIGSPSNDEQQRHYLYRFWKSVPEPGTIVIFDRSWYGRVLVERVEKLVPKDRWKEAYREINEFEKLLSDDGVEIIKLFLAIDKKEQLQRFEERLCDPYKNWKLTPDDFEARKKWDDYVEAGDDLLERTDTEEIPWHLIPANDKDYARDKVLEIVTQRLKAHGKWMEEKVASQGPQNLKKSLKALKLEKENV